MTPPARRPLPPPQSSSFDFQVWFANNWPIVTKVIIFFLGVAILVNELLVASKPDPVAVGGGFGLVGVVPFTFKSNGNGNGKT